jgi:hypothetical protein
MEVFQSELESQTTVQPTSVNVTNLTFIPSRKPLKKYLEYVRYELTLVNMAWLLPFYKGEHRKMLLMGAPLRNVSFRAISGELTAIIGDEMERREVVELMTGRKKSGTFDGSISLCGENIDSKSYYYDHIAFVQKVYVQYCFVDFSLTDLFLRLLVETSVHTRSNIHGHDHIRR